MKLPRIRKNLIQRVMRFLVAGLAVTLLFFIELSPECLLPCITLLLLGGAWRVWCNAVLDKGKIVCQVGPYSFVRHPMYLGTMLVTFGYLLLWNIGWDVKGAVLACVFLNNIWRAIWEERRLAERFGAAYDEYRKKIMMWIPSPLALAKAVKEKRVWGYFSWDKLRDNGEIARMAIGLATIVAIWIYIEFKTKNPILLNLLRDDIGPEMLILFAAGIFGYFLARATPGGILKRKETGSQYTPTRV